MLMLIFYLNFAKFLLICHFHSVL